MRGKCLLLLLETVKSLHADVYKCLQPIQNLNKWSFGFLHFKVKIGLVGA